MTSVTGSVAAGCTLPVEVLMKSPPASIASQRRAADVVVGRQLAGLEDHLEVGARRRPAFDRDDLVEDLQVAAGEERAAVDHHVDLVGAGLDGVRGVGELESSAARPLRERGGDGGDVDAGCRRAPPWPSATMSG